MVIIYSVIRNLTLGLTQMLFQILVISIYSWINIVTITVLDFFLWEFHDRHALYLFPTPSCWNPKLNQLSELYWKSYRGTAKMQEPIIEKKIAAVKAILD